MIFKKSVDIPENHENSVNGWNYLWEEKHLFELSEDALTSAPIVVVALQTGMRQGEMLGLKREQVDLNQKTIYVAHTKTGRPRKLPMSKPLEVELRSLKQDGASIEQVFSYSPRV